MTVDCNECVATVHRLNSDLWDACATVGAKYSKPTEDVLRSYLGTFHDMGHPKRGER